MDTRAKGCLLDTRLDILVYIFNHIYRFVNVQISNHYGHVSPNEPGLPGKLVQQLCGNRADDAQCEFELYTNARLYGRVYRHAIMGLSHDQFH